MYSVVPAAKSLQSCPTLCDPRDDSPPGSSVPGVLQARMLEWVAISFSNVVPSNSHFHLHSSLSQWVWMHRWSCEPLQPHLSMQTSLSFFSFYICSDIVQQVHLEIFLEILCWFYISRNLILHVTMCLPTAHVIQFNLKTKSAERKIFLTRDCTVSGLVLLWLILDSVQFSHSVVCDSLTSWTAARQASLSITNSWSSPKPIFIESVMPSNHLILCHPLLLLPSIFSSIRVFSNKSALRIRWPKYWSFSLNISPTMNTQDWSLGWTGRISLQSKGLSRVFSDNTVQKHQFFGAQHSL